MIKPNLTQFKYAAAPVALAIAMVSAPSFAQEVPAADEAAAEDAAIVVTGSRIQRRQFDSAAPVAVVSDEEFKLSGAVNVEQVINTLPQVVPGATAFSNNPGGGVATLNLRGIGTARTLVLVNGRRYVSFDASQIVDLNTIPQFMLDSVDVVTGGASAVYGSDALSGVVNFRLRDDFSGIEVGSQYSLTGEGDGGRFQTNVALGGSFDDDRGNVVVFGEYFKRKAVFQGARDFSRNALVDGDGTLDTGGSATTPQGRISVGATSVIATPVDLNDDGDFEDDGETITLPRGVGNFGTAFGANFGTPGVSDVFDFPGDLYNYAPANFLQVPQERFLAGGYGKYEVSKALTAYVEVTFINNRVEGELASTPATGTFNVSLAGAQPYLSAADFAALQQLDANETAINAARAGNGLAALFGPSGAAGTVQLSIGRRIIETGPRNSSDERNAFRLLGGVTGAISDTFNYDAYYSYARTRNSQVQDGNISRSAYTAAVQSGAINIFGANTLSPEDVAGISILAQNGEVSVLQVASGSISGTLGNFGFGGDDIGIAVGAEWRSQNALFIPDTALSSGDVIGFNAGDPTEGGYSVKEVFGELRLPIAGGTPGIERLELTGAARYSDYSLANVGGVFTYAGGLEYSPVADLTLRAQYQHAVRAPNVGELFGGQSNGFPGATDPCSDRQAVANRTAAVRALCVATGVPTASVFTPGIQANGQIEATFGGNPDLQEETSDSYTFGAVFRPSFIPRFVVSADYFNIKVEDYISTLGGGLSNTLNLCYNVIQDINSIYCQAIANGGRDPATGIIGGEFLPLIGNANVARLETSGVDLQVDYTAPLSFGILGNDSKLNFSFLGTYTIDNKFFAVQELEAFVDCAGAFGQNVCGNPQPEYKWSSRLSWIDGPITTSLRWRHLGQARDDDNGTDFVVETLNAYDVFDLSFAAEISDNLTMSAGISNLFDVTPQLLGDNQEQANTYPSSYDVLGRDFFVSVNFRF